MSSPGYKSRLVITFKNGSGSVVTCASVPDAYEYANTKISLGSKVARVELITWPSSCRPLWDAEWDAKSQSLGLRCPA